MMRPGWGLNVELTGLSMFLRHECINGFWGFSPLYAPVVRKQPLVPILNMKTKTNLKTNETSINSFLMKIMDLKRKCKNSS